MAALSIEIVKHVYVRLLTYAFYANLKRSKKEQQKQQQASFS